MHDIKAIREDPAGFDAGLARRGLGAASGALLTIDARRRMAIQEAEVGQARRKALSAEFGRLKAQRLDVPDALVAELESLKQATQDDAALHEAELTNALAALPNLPAPEVPNGKSEDDNVIVHVRGAQSSFAFQPAEHADFGPALGMDFESAQAVAGARFVYLRGQAARLSRALGAFMLDMHTGEFGYQEVAPPLLVREHAMFGTGQLPKFGADSYRTEGEDGRWLIPTAEVSLTNLVREKILDEGELPLRFTALTPCFRSEAGAAGRDTRGLIRQHQFDKVELVSITTPKQSEAEHERMTAAAETILDRLVLPYRRMLLCAGDMGFSAKKTYDLEVWLPGQDRYREISSCSNCGDFQARRMNARYRAHSKDNRFVHTLNGSALAVGRALVAVLENYQDEGGAVAVPEVLVPYMGGVTRLEP